MLKRALFHFNWLAGKTCSRIFTRARIPSIAMYRCIDDNRDLAFLELQNKSKNLKVGCQASAVSTGSAIAVADGCCLGIHA